MAKTDEILAAVIETRTNMKNLSNRLYDEDGDIPAIKDKLNHLNGKTQDQESRLVILETKEILSNSDNPHKRLSRRQTAIGGGGVVAVAGIIYGIGAGLGWW